MAKRNRTNSTPATTPATEPTTPAHTPEQVEAMRTRLAALQAEVATLQGTLASYQQHLLVTSTIAKPVAIFRDIFMAHHPGTGTRRRDVIRKGVLAGIAENTCKTQYQVLKGKYERGELNEAIEALNLPVEGPAEF